MRILFHDASAARPYDAALMRREALGGTESTVVRIAQGLAADHEVAVAQHGRDGDSPPQAGVRYVSLEDPAPFGGNAPHWVVVVRKHREVPRLAARFPSARLALWVHNWQRAEVVFFRAELARSRCTVIAVSEAHRLSTEATLNGAAARAIGALGGGGGGGRITVIRIPNPVDDALAPDATPVETDKLLYFSNKGVHEVLSAFSIVRSALPSLQLHVAGPTPEVMKSCGPLAEQAGLHYHGRLQQDEVLRHLRAALCVFYPQHVHAETFGLVFAEANAVGTPVLAHDFGSAREVLGAGEQLVDGADFLAMATRLRDWQAGARPKVALRPEFRLASVLGEWRRLLEGPPGAAPR